MVKESLEELAHPEYWDARYSAENEDARVYDWLRKFGTIRPFLEKHLPKPTQHGGPKILHLGSGNSVRIAVKTSMYILWGLSEARSRRSQPT